MGWVGRNGFLVVVVLALLAPPAIALAQNEPPTRGEFVDAADAICEAPYRKGLRLLGDAGALAGGGRLVRAGVKVVRAGHKFLRANDRLAELEPPPMDAPRIAAWLDGTRQGFEQVLKSGRALRHRRAHRSERLLDRAKRTTGRANARVAEFGFDFCA